MSEYRVIMNRSGHETRVEVYYFPPIGEQGITSYATVGLSCTPRSDGRLIGTEWVLALTPELGGESVDRVFSYVCDLVAHHIAVSTDSEIPRVMEESALAPSGWTTRALLLDELRGESEALEELRVGSETVQVLWAVPITAEEASLLLEEGLEAFDEYMDDSDEAIIDPRRS
ncbi:hypothetical protein PA598K_01820 [Paenibacillus sp. 598K]|uniref:suppressor of fused domain protein n=1 Tax=Paenibacillus sp. 598K TaxID=1117987 RepID=UPI000FFA4DCD|nr:suppressor of fused domain protein [Paenibacillus sp. 598K]GBF73527.1 hypothetical protein PA598K_01820 [Paenibacillus sp. 598K]